LRPGVAVIAMPSGAERPEEKSQNATQNAADSRAARYRRNVSLRVASVLIWCALVSCGHGSSERPPPTHEAVGDGVVRLTGESRRWVRVEEATAPGPTARRSLFAHVTFDEHLVSAVGSPVSGRVMSVNVVTGARVERGDTLAMIHSVDLAAARTAQAQARQASTLADANAVRDRRLYNEGAGSLTQALASETAAAQAHLEETRARETLSAIGATGSGADFPLRAPRAGTIVQRQVDVGAAVGADTGAALFMIADLSAVWVLVDVYEHDLTYVDLHDAAHVIIPALDDLRIDSEIAYVGNIVDATTRAAQARIELSNADGRLRPGMFAEVEIESPDSAVAIVPTSSVLARRDEFYVFVQTGEGTYEQRPVRIGVRDGEHVGILEGVAPGNPIVTRGAILLDAEANTAF
jgi:cobalt-zinc-cadmium efflux system membrane fusion protein